MTIRDRKSDISPFTKVWKSGKQDSRDERTTMVIVCEGEKTEVNYFKAFEVTNDVFFDHVTSPDQVLAKAVERKKNLDPNGSKKIEFWCVFDRDIQHTNHGPIDSSIRGSSIKSSQAEVANWLKRIGIAK